MATRASLQPQLVPSSDTASVVRFTSNCVILSNHPVAVALIENSVCSDVDLRPLVNFHPYGTKSVNSDGNWILILDTCSVPDWPDCMKKWHADGGITITLLPLEKCTQEVELQLLYQGIVGTLPFNDTLNVNLPKAIRAVSEGRIWMRREVLDLYVKRTSWLLQKMADYRLTMRENQVLNLIRQKASNRTIAQKLLISERTVKFHISNILRKLNLSNRHELHSSNFSSAVVLNAIRCDPQAPEL